MPTYENGKKLWIYTGTLTVAASPLLSGWIDTNGFTQVIPWMSFTGGTSAHTIQGSFDGATQDTDMTSLAVTSGTPLTILYPFIRWSTVQTVGTATVAKIYLQSRT